MNVDENAPCVNANAHAFQIVASVICLYLNIVRSSLIICCVLNLIEMSWLTFEYTEIESLTLVASTI